MHILSADKVLACRESVVLMLCDCLASSQERAQLRTSSPLLNPLTPHQPISSVLSSRIIPFRSLCVFAWPQFALVVIFVVLAALDTALALTMAEPSKGRQSKLRNMQRPPDSDTVVPETQLEADEYGIEDGDLDIDDDLAVLEKCSFKKPAESTATASQAPAVPVQTNAFVRLASAKTEEPKDFAIQAFHKAPPRRNEPAVKPLVHPDIVLPSVEPSTKEKSHQGTGLIVRDVSILKIRR